MKVGGAKRGDGRCEERSVWRGKVNEKEEREVW